MKKLNLLLTLALFAVGLTTANAQVKFKLSYKIDTDQYTVSVMPEATYTSPQNITGTGQVTIKVPTNQFDPVDIENHMLGMYWEANSRNDSPTEAPDWDYISFGLNIQGVAFPDYEEGVELPLFSFTNAFGCTGEIYIVDNQNDPFFPPNSENANIGNTLTILGAGGDAYDGIIGNGKADCAASPTATEEEIALSSYRIFPNPAVDVANIEIEWEGQAEEAYLQVVDATGKKVMVEQVDLVRGENTKQLIVSPLAAGNYFVYLVGDDWDMSLDKITKQ